MLIESTTNWWEDGWVWTAIGTIAAIIIGIIKLIILARNSQKSGKRRRGK